MNSHNKPAQKAIHTNNQSMEVASHSGASLSTSLQTVGFEMNVAQLSEGALNGVFSLGGSRQLPVLSIQTKQDLLLHGNRRPGVMPLSAMLQRASAPGISIQSVSVAQSPQMAIALR